MRSANSTKPKGKPRARTVKNIRAVLGRTQAELAAALGISAKAVQSYEQGWRPAPVRVMIQLLVLLSIQRRQQLHDVPCWTLKKCARATRERCPAFTVGRGQFCWFIGIHHCTPRHDDDPARVLACMACPVIQRLLKGSGING